MQWRELMKLSKNSEAWRFMWSHFQMQSSPSLVIKADYCRSTKLKTFSSYRKNPKLLNIVAYCWTKKIQSRSITSAPSFSVGKWIKRMFICKKGTATLHTHGVWKSQKKSHSRLRAKRATFTFWVDRSSSKWSIWRVFENLKLAVKQCYQTGQF